jgi:hypothetical protein
MCRKAADLKMSIQEFGMFVNCCGESSRGGLSGPPSCNQESCGNELWLVELLLRNHGNAANAAAVSDCFGAIDTEML